MITTTAGRKPRILVADDLEVQRNLLGELLEPQGYEILYAEDGDQALELARQKDIDLALLDVMMPHRTGFAVCRAVKADPEMRLTPVVLVTGLDNVDDRIQGIESGADEFLSKPFNEQELLSRVRSLLKLKRYVDELERSEAVLFTLARCIEGKDPYTEGHCERLAKYGRWLAKRLSLSEEEVIAVERGAIVHDLGKVGVPENILLKPGPLTAEEREVMKLHPVVGERICAPLQSFQSVLPIIRHHHERMDGSGYPDGLRGDEIPLTARILTIIDIYDSLTTDRPYRKALPPAEAFGQMWEEASRGWWDKVLLSMFEQLLANPSKK